MSWTSRAVAASFLSTCFATATANYQNIDKNLILSHCAYGTQRFSCEQAETPSECNTSYVPTSYTTPSMFSPCYWSDGTCNKVQYDSTNLLFQFGHSAPCCPLVPTPVCAPTPGSEHTCIENENKYPNNQGCNETTFSDKTCIYNNDDEVLLDIHPATCGYAACSPVPIKTCDYTVPATTYGPEFDIILLEASYIIGPYGKMVGDQNVTRSDLAVLTIPSFTKTDDGIDIYLDFGDISNMCVKEAIISVLIQAAKNTQEDNVEVKATKCNNVKCDSLTVCPETDTARRRRSAASSAHITIRKKTGLNGGEIAGIVIGSVAGVALIAGAVWYKWFRKQNGRVSPEGKMYWFL